VEGPDARGSNAYDLAAVFVAGGVLPGLNRKQSVTFFDLDGMAQFIYPIGL
jgi:hypothetical protein